MRPTEQWGAHAQGNDGGRGDAVAGRVRWFWIARVGGADNDNTDDDRPDHYEHYGSAHNDNHADDDRPDHYEHYEHYGSAHNDNHDPKRAHRRAPPDRADRGTDLRAAVYARDNSADEGPRVLTRGRQNGRFQASGPPD